MKAFVLEEFGLAEDRPLTFTDVEIPSVGDGKVLIKVSACGVCHTDLH
ncbi:MAG TPA: alcohol dehydrogenase, partial [Firmicutes bacterium]|nr:alcohol dehydrogenase [Bacillota bacterium]